MNELDSDTTEEVTMVGNQVTYGEAGTLGLETLELAEQCATPKKTCCKAKRISVRLPTPPDIVQVNWTNGWAEEPINSFNISREDVELAAYYKWLDAGMPQDDGVQNWLAAEQELTNRQTQ